MVAKKSVTIDNKEYSLDSDNSLLLKEMPEVSVKIDNVWKKVKYKYIPIGIIKTLLDNLTDSYDVQDDWAKYEEEFKVDRTDRNWKSETKHLRMYSYSITYTIRLDGVVTILKWYCRGVASINILCSDGSANGFFQKLSARATKSALKNFAKVFRMDDEADDVIDWESPGASDEAEKPTEKPYTPKENAKVVAKSNDTANAWSDETVSSNTAGSEDNEAAKKTKAVVQEGPAQEDNEALEKRYTKRFNDLIQIAWTTSSDLSALVKVIRKEDEITTKSDKRIDILRKVFDTAIESLKVLDAADIAPKEKKAPAKKEAKPIKKNATVDKVMDEINASEEASDSVKWDQERYDDMFANYLKESHTVEELREFAKKIINDEKIQKWDPRHEMIKALWSEAKALIESQANDI